MAGTPGFPTNPWISHEELLVPGADAGANEATLAAVRTR